MSRGWAKDGVDWDAGPLSANIAIAIVSAGPLGKTMSEPNESYLATMDEIEAEHGSLLDWEFEDGRTAEQVTALLRAKRGALRIRSAEEIERAREQGERFCLAIERQANVLRQMKARSGPVYDLARERSHLIGEAYRAAGSPRQVTTHWSHEGGRLVPHHVFVIRRGGKWHHEEPATEAEAEKWYVWERERDSLRRRLQASIPRQRA